MNLLFPEEYLEAFEPMLMEAPTTKFKEIKQIVEAEFKKPLNEIFELFEEIPVASASLA